MGVMMGATDEDTVSSLAGRLARLNKQLDDNDLAKIREKTGGVELTQIVGGLLSAIDPDNVEKKAQEIEPTAAGEDTKPETRSKAQDTLVKEAAKIFTGELVELLDGIRRDKEQTIDHDNLDNIIRAEWDGDAAENAQALVKDFETYLEENRDEIEALTIFYSQPHRRRQITYAMIRDVMEKLKSERPKLAPLRVWSAYARLDDYKGDNPVSELTALISLIRRACGIDKTSSRHSETVRRNFQNWIMQHHSGGTEKFNEAQMQWLRMIRDHVISSFHIEKDDLDMAPFDAQGGMGKMYKLFGTDMDRLIDELNEALAA